MDDVAPEGLPREVADLLHDPTVYLSADQLALEKIKAWMYAPDGPTATRPPGATFAVDRHLWAVGGTPADSSTTPSAA
jgi:hypothetical protein